MLNHHDVSFKYLTIFFVHCPLLMLGKNLCIWREKNNIFIAAFTTTWEKQEHECAFVTASVWWGVGCQNVGAGDSEVSVGSRPSSSCFTLPVTPRVAPRLPRESARRNRNQRREASPLPRHVVPDLASGSEPLRKSHPQGEGQRKPGVP